VLKDELFFQRKVGNCIKALNEILFSNKYLHPTTLEYLAKSSDLVESGNYTYNVLMGSGLTPKITKDQIKKAPVEEQDDL